MIGKGAQNGRKMGRYRPIMRQYPAFKADMRGYGERKGLNARKNWTMEEERCLVTDVERSTIKGIWLKPHDNFRIERYEEN